MVALLHSALASLRSDFALTAAYTRMVRGFGGHPKFAKSIHGSAIEVATPPCREGGQAWRREVARFAAYVIDLIDRWPR